MNRPDFGWQDEAQLVHRLARHTPHRVAGQPAASAPIRVFHPDDLHATIAFRWGVESAARHAWATLPAAPGGPYEATWGPIVPMGPPRRYSALAAGSIRPPETFAHRWRCCSPSCSELPAPAQPDIRRAPRDPRPTPGRAYPACRGLAWAAELALPVPTVGRVALYTWSDNRSDCFGWSRYEASVRLDSLCRTPLPSQQALPRPDQRHGVRVLW